MRPTISVVIPLYNKRDGIERCLRSVRSQTFTDYQIIVVNDGSTDGSEQLVERFLQAGDAFISQENAGVSAARNRAMQEATGEVFAFLDADDRWLPGHLAAIHELAERFPEAGLFGTGERKARRWFVRDHFVAGGEPRVVSYFRNSVNESACTGSSTAVRRQAFEQLGGFLLNEPVGEDLEYWARVSLHWAMAVHPTVSAVIHACPSRNEARAVRVNRCGPELAYGMVEDALESGRVATELQPDIRAYIAGQRIRRARFLVGRGFFREAADTLRNGSVSANTKVTGFGWFIKLCMTLAEKFPEPTKGSRLVGKMLRRLAEDPEKLAVRLCVPIRRHGMVVKGHYVRAYTPCSPQ